jgi:hypothetical protein
MLLHRLFSFDSTSAISIARDPVKQELTNHIGVYASYIRSQLHYRIATLGHVPFEVHRFFHQGTNQGAHGLLLSKLNVIEPP